VPDLIVQLWLRESQMGRPLTEPEVLNVRDEGTAIALPRSEHESYVCRPREYRDIDPEDCWIQWRSRRTETSFLM
jgi:hypothetical protein